MDRQPFYPAAHVPKNVPGGDLESRTKDLRSHEFRHDEEEESVVAASAASGGLLGSKGAFCDGVCRLSCPVSSCGGRRSGVGVEVGKLG